jgi:hypothetical protein
MNITNKTNIVPLSTACKSVTKYRVVNRKRITVINFKIAALKIIFSKVLQTGSNGEGVACGFEHLGALVTALGISLLLDEILVNTVLTIKVHLTKNIKRGYNYFSSDN